MVKQMERYSTSSVVMELQIKTPMRCYFMSKRRAKNVNPVNTRVVVMDTMQQELS